MSIITDNVVGERFGRWFAIGPISLVNGKPYSVLCRCDCGTERKVYIRSLLRGKSNSCRCLAGEMARVRNQKHGLSRSPEHDAWSHLKQRCDNPNDKGFPDYGGRGITYCDEWKSFDAFYRDMGPRPSAIHSIDRIDNNGPYCPSNCRWATDKEQSCNTRRNLKIEYLGESLTVGEWANRLGIKRSTLSYRLYVSKWSVEKSLTTNTKPTTHDITYQGQTHSIVEWASLRGISQNTIRTRIHKGWPVSQVLKK